MPYVACWKRTELVREPIEVLPFEVGAGAIVVDRLGNRCVLPEGATYRTCGNAVSIYDKSGVQIWDTETGDYYEIIARGE